MKRLVLAGGGHAHVEVLRRFGRERPSGAEIVLVSPNTETPYSGMLPGFVAGFYRREAMFIDLARLATACGARFERTLVTTIDPGARHVTLANGAQLGYDVLSLDIGSTPATGGISGVETHAIPVKPIPAFIAKWEHLLARAARGGLRSLAVVGGGAAGVEVLLSMQHRLRDAAGRDVAYHLLTDTPTLFPSHGEAVRRIFARVLAARGVQVHALARVSRVTGSGVQLASGVELEADAVVWATGAAASRLPGAAGLAVDPAGFVAVNACLQSTSHPQVFGAGDVASMVATPHPKSGVYAVRQGPPLTYNLRAALAGAPLTSYFPQRFALALITTGDRYAVASRGDLTLEGRMVWRWKDWIDRRFVARYRVGS